MYYESLAFICHQIFMVWIGTMRRNLETNTMQLPNFFLFGEINRMYIKRQTHDISLGIFIRARIQVLSTDSTKNVKQPIDNRILLNNFENSYSWCSMVCWNMPHPNGRNSVKLLLIHVFEWLYFHLNCCFFVYFRLFVCESANSVISVYKNWYEVKFEREK